MRDLAVSRILLLMLLIPWTGCVPTVRSAPAASSLTAAVSSLTPEDSVHHAVIALHAHAEESGVVLLSDSTHDLVRSPGDTTGLRAFGTFVTELSPDLVADFRQKVEEKVALNPEVVQQFTPRVRTWGSLEHRPQEDPETRESTLADGTEVQGTLTLSRVGFDREGRQALLHMYSGGGVGGTAYLVLLRRGADNRWQIERSQSGWQFH